MNNSNFNANRLVSVNATLNLMESAFEQLANAGSGYGGSQVHGANLKFLIGSDDSNLSSSWEKSADLTREVVYKADSLVSKIRDEFEIYIRSTLNNENTTNSVINNINRALEEDIEMLMKMEI